MNRSDEEVVKELVSMKFTFILLKWQMVYIQFYYLQNYLCIYIFLLAWFSLPHHFPIQVMVLLNIIFFLSTVLGQWSVLWKSCWRRDQRQLPGDLLLWFPPHGWAFVLPKALPVYRTGPEHKTHGRTWVLSSASGALGSPVPSDCKFVMVVMFYNHSGSGENNNAVCNALNH